MKYARTLLCLLLVLCSLVSMAVPALATEVTEPEAPEVSVTEPVEVPTEEPTEAPAEEPTEAPAEEPTEAPAEEPTEAPAEEPTEAPAEEPTEAPAEEPTEATMQASGSAETYNASSGTWHNLNWSLSSGTLTITGSGEMYESYKNYPWTSSSSQVTKIVIGDYVTSISRYAFSGMSNLTQVTIGKSVASIAYQGFYQCGNLTKVTFATGSKLTSIGKYAFTECKKLQSISFPAALTEILDSAFQYCSSLTSVTFGTKLKTIGYGVFYGCSALSKVNLPTSLRTIDDYAFYKCTALTSIELPYGLQTLGGYAFYGCTALTGSVKIPGTVTTWEYHTFEDTALTEAAIYSACAIPAHAFDTCLNLSSLTIGSTVTGIGDLAFAENEALTTANLPASIKNIGYRAFYCCFNLSKVTFSSGLTSIGDAAFYYAAMPSVKLPNSVTSIGEYTFARNSALTSVTLGSGLTTIPTYAFYNCANLQDVTLGSKVTSIGDYAFMNCTALSAITWPTSLKTISRGVFSGTSLVSIDLPASVTTIGASAFASCSKLQSVSLGQNISMIGDKAFDMCRKLTSFKTFSNNTAYENNPLSYCSSVTVYGWAGSTSETFARNNSIPFVPLTSLETPVNKKIQNTVSGIHVYWEPVTGAAGYDLYRSTSAGGSYTLVKESITAAHFTDTSVTSGQVYYYKVVAHNGNVKSGYSDCQSLAFVGTPDITSRINKAAGIQLGWDKISGATGYAIYRKPYEGNAAWVRVATITGGSTVQWTDTSVKNANGTVYRYTIRALHGSTLSGCRNTGRTMVRLCSQVMNSATKAGSTSIKCSWTTSKAVTGYEVRFVVDGKVYKTFTVGNYATGTKTFTGLKAGCSYQIQVRTYKKVNGVGSFYSAWSTAKYVTL